MNKTSFVSPQSKDVQSLQGDQFVAIKNVLQENNNILDPTHPEAAKKADIQGYLNGELPHNIRIVVENFAQSLVGIIHPIHIENSIPPMPKNLSRKARKVRKQQNNSISKPTIIVPIYSTSVQKLQHQVAEAISTDTPLRKSSIDFSGARQLKEEKNRRVKSENQIRADFYRVMQHLGIPKHVFFTAPLNHIEELANQYLAYPESAVTMKNYTHDIMKHIIVPAFEKRVSGNFNQQNEVYQRLVDLCYKVCFSHKNREGNLHPHVLTSYVAQGNDPGLKISDVRGALSEAYGKYVLENMHNYIPESAFVCKPLPMQDSARRILDLHAKSDAVYKVTSSDNTEMLWAVDFKNRGERKEAGEVYSSLDIEENDTTSVTSMYDRKDLTHKLRRNLRTDKTIPVKGMLLYMGLPKSFHEMHFTPSMIQADAEHFYNQLLQASTNSSSPTQ